jgi:hypothetical protein
MNILIILIALYEIFCDTNSTTFTQKFDDDLFHSINGLTVRSENSIREILGKTDMTYFVYVYLKSSPNSRTGAEILAKVAEKLNFLAGILLVDCDDYETDNPKICTKPEGAKDGFPKMFLYVPPEFKHNPYTKQVNEHTTKPYDKNEVSESLIYNFIIQNIPSRSVALNTENHETFMSNFAMNKVILFTEKPKAPLMWRGLSNYFYDRIAFAHVGKDQTALTKKYQIQTFPTIIIHQVHEEEAPLETQTYQIYVGKLDATDIAQAFEKFALEEKMYIRAESVKNPEELKYRTVFKKLNKNDYEKYLSKFVGWKYIILMAINDEIPEAVKRFNKETAGFFHFVKFDCRENFCKDKFNVKTLPQLIYFTYSPIGNVDTQLSNSRNIPFQNYDSIYGEISDIFPEGFKTVDPYDFQKTIMESTSNKKVPLLYFYDDAEVPLGLRLLSSNPNYRKYIDFLEISNPPAELINKFKITSLPQLLFIVIADPKQPDS